MIYSICQNENKYLIIFILTFVFQISFAQENSSFSKSNDNSEMLYSDHHFVKLDSLFIESNYEEFALELNKITIACDSCGILFINFLSEWTDTIVHYTKSEIDSMSYVVALENIKILDDLNFYLLEQNLKWKSKEKVISDLKCKYNLSLKKTFSNDILKAYNLFKTSSKLSDAGELIAKSQFYRSKFFRDVCFDRNSYDNDIKKVVEVSNWIEKATIESKYQKLLDKQPVWVQMGMTFEQYQEYWAQKLTPGSDYMGGGGGGKSLHKGKRGGTYYINSNGNKQYVPRK